MRYFNSSRCAHGRDHTSGCSYNVRVFPIEELASSDITLDVCFEFLDGGVPRPFHSDHLRTFFLKRAPSGELSGAGDISGAGELSRWLNSKEGVPSIATNAALSTIMNALVDWSQTTRATATITVNFAVIIDDDDLEEVLRRSEEGYSGGGRVGLDVSRAVEVLEKVVIRVSEKCCGVCLEEFSVGFEATQMPCSHVFHGDCIVKWLENRCVCLLCRFELVLETST